MLSNKKQSLQKPIKLNKFQNNSLWKETRSNLPAALISIRKKLMSHQKVSTLTSLKYKRVKTLIHQLNELTKILKTHLIPNYLSKIISKRSLMHTRKRELSKIWIKNQKSLKNLFMATLLSRMTMLRLKLKFRNLLLRKGKRLILSSQMKKWINRLRIYLSKEKT